MGESMWGRTSIGRTRAHFTEVRQLGFDAAWGGTATATTTSFSYTAPPPTPPPSYNLATSTYGNTIPVSAGERRLPGAYIWAKVDQNFEQQRELNPDGTERLSEDTFLFNPFADIAVSFGYNGEPDAPTQLSKVYLDGVEASLSSLDYTFYPGSETQQPDPTIRRDKGAANTPAFRGQTYMVIRNIDLSRFGNRFPAVSAVINSSGVPFAEYEFDPVEREDLALFVQWIGADFPTGRAWGYALNNDFTRVRIVEYDVSNPQAGLPVAFMSDEVDDIPVPFIDPLFEKCSYVPWEDLFFSVDNLSGTFSYIAFTRAGSLSASTDAIMSGLQTKDFRPFQSGAPIKTLAWHLTTDGDFYGEHVLRLVEFDGGQFSILDQTSARIDGIGPEPDDFQDLYRLGAATSGLALGGESAWMVVGVNASGGRKAFQLVRLSWDGSEIDASPIGSPFDPGIIAEVTGIVYSQADQTIVVLYVDDDVSPNAARPGGAVKFTQAGDVVYSVFGMPQTFNEMSSPTFTTTFWQCFSPNSRVGSKLFLCSDVFGEPKYVTAFDLMTAQFENYEIPEGSVILPNNYRGQLFDSVENDFILINYSPDSPESEQPSGVLFTVGSGGTQVGSTLSGSLVGRATTLAEINESDITTINLDEPIRGWMVWENGEYRQHLANDGMIFGFDWFESGEGITLKRHVDATNFNVDRVLTNDDLLLIEDSDAQVARVDEQEIAAIARVSYIDPSVEFRVSQQRARRARFPIPAVNSNRTAEYTTSVIMDARTALSNATKALFREDVGRVVLTFHLAPRRIDIETGDVVQLPPIAGKVWTVRIVETILREDFVTECSAQVLLENEAIDLEGFSGTPFVYTNGPPRLMRSPFVPSQAEAFPSEITEASS